MKLLSSAIVMLCLLLAAQTPMVSQNARSAAEAQLELLSSVPKGLPSDLLLQVRPLGMRFQRPGKEETVLTARLFDGIGDPKPVRIVHQLSGMVLVEGAKERIPLSFDGEAARGAVDRKDEALLETFVMDTVEGLIYSSRSGGSVRLLGRHFGPAPGAGLKDYTGPYYDIYEALAPVRSRADRQLRMKRYYFDSQSQMLVSTRYMDSSFSPPVRVETRFSNWQEVEGSAYPAKIERYENDNLVFSLAVTSATSRARGNAASFR